MKTLNTGEDVPEILYVFLEFGGGIFDQINEHNYKLNHKLVSSGMSNCCDVQKENDFINGDIDYLPFVATDITTNSPSSFMMKIINEYNIEHNLEWYRKTNFRKFPSRLSGLYAFGDYDSCIQVSQKYNWNMDSVRKLRLTSGKKVVKLNMEIVSMLRSIFIQTFSQEYQSIIYDRYWRGEGEISIQNPSSGETINSGVIYEYLIEGILEEIVE